MGEILTGTAQWIFAFSALKSAACALKSCHYRAKTLYALLLKPDSAVARELHGALEKFNRFET
jgi:hypothetical protein